MSKRHPNRFKVPHNRDLTTPYPPYEESAFIDYDKRYRQQALEAGCFLNGQGDPVNPGQHPVATIDIAIHLGRSQVGCGAVLRSESINDNGGGCCPLPGQNRIVLRALITMLPLLTTAHAVTVTCASDYLVDNMMEGHTHRWRREDWKTRSGDPIKSRDLWEQILALGDIHRLRFE